MATNFPSLWIPGICCCEEDDPSDHAYGYMFGGTGGTSPNEIGRLDYATETTSLLSDALNGGQLDSGAATHAGEAIYIFSVFTDPDYDTDKLALATETVSTLASGQIEDDGTIGEAISERTAKAYHCGGRRDDGTFQPSDVAEVLTFSSETLATSGTATLPHITERPGACNSPTAGYIAGGRGAFSSFLDDISKTTFASDTSAAIAATLATACDNLAGASDGTTNGYFAGGRAGSTLTTVQRLVFSTDGISTVAGAALNSARQRHASFASADDAYWLCGNVGSWEKTDFATETTSTGSSTFSGSPVGVCGAGDQGY